MHIVETEAMYCSFLILLLVISSTASDHQINITKNYELEFLCSGTQLLNDTTVKLSTNIYHFIHNAPYCIMNITYSLSIISNSSQQAVIHCNDSITQPTSGFVFTNVQNLTIKMLFFRGCGGYLKKLDVMKLINSTDSPVHFSQYQSAVLLFLHINTILISEVNITNYYGFAMFAINPSSASMNHSSISISISNGTNCFGSGTFLFSTDILDMQPFTSFKFSINYAVFETNYECTHPSVTCLSDLKHNIERLPIANAAGLTVFCTQKKLLLKLLCHNHISFLIMGEQRWLCISTVLHSHRLSYQVPISRTTSTLIPVLVHTFHFSFMSVIKSSTTVKIINFIHLPFIIVHFFLIVGAKIILGQSFMHIFTTH